MSYNYVIKSNDPQAINMLKENLEYTKNRNQYMQDVNDYFKAHGTVIGCPGVDDETAVKLNERVSNEQLTPYPGSFFKSNNDEIKRLQANIDRLETKRDTVFCGWLFNSGEAIVNLANNRLQLKFNEKPSEEQRNVLKQHGFKWAPTAEVWQRPLDYKTMAAVDKIDFIKPNDGRKPSDLQPKQQKRNQPER